LHIHTGKTETTAEVLRSILAQLDFSYTVRDFHDRQGVPFRHHLYVPEIHPETNLPFCEREDEAHVLKVHAMLNITDIPYHPSFPIQRIAQSTRMGGPTGMHLECFLEALQDPHAHLTYTALTGARKQSVADAEHLFSPDVLAFLEKKGYTFEAHYVRVIFNWRFTYYLLS